MTSHCEKRFLPYTPDQVFALVADVERYPEFLPWCESLKILSRETIGDTQRLVAEMRIGFKVYNERFKTVVLLDRARGQIAVDYLEGPFKRLTNSWMFAAARGGTELEFAIDFEFKSFPLQMLVGKLFEQAFRRLVTAFDARARVLYGVPRVGQEI